MQILNPKNNGQSLELTCKALASGISHTVITWIDQMDGEGLSELEHAARSGQCNGLTIRNRSAA